MRAEADEVLWMNTGATPRPRVDSWERTESTLTPSATRPLLRPAPRSAMFFPLAVIVAVLPGLFALNSWDLTPPGPWWGMRGLAVLDGLKIDQTAAAFALGDPAEARAYQTIAMQPPLYAWLEAIGLAMSYDRDPLATVLPSYIAGAAVVVLVYLHGRLWFGQGTALTAAVLVGLNRGLIGQMQQASPTTLGLAGALLALLGYGWRHRVKVESRRPVPWAGSGFWTIVGGVGLGISLLSVGLFGLAVVPAALLHQACLGAGSPPAERVGRWWQVWRRESTVLTGVASLAIGLAIALPWHFAMLRAHGAEFLGALLEPFDPSVGPATGPGLLGRLLRLAPTALPLGLYGAYRSIGVALSDETGERNVVGRIFWVAWMSVAALVPAFWPEGPGPVLDLFLAIPMILLAALTMAELAARAIHVRTILLLGPATAVSICWAASGTLRRAVADLNEGHASASTLLGLHLAFDLFLAVVFASRLVDRWARRRDGRQRCVIGVFLAVVLVLTTFAGIREATFRHRETDDLLTLRSMILRRHREQPFRLLALVVGDRFRPANYPADSGPAPGGRLRFILRDALPDTPERDLETTDALLNLPDAPRLVIIAGAAQPLSYILQSRLGLEAIHPGRQGELEAFATALPNPRLGSR